MLSNTWFVECNSPHYKHCSLTKRLSTPPNSRHTCRFTFVSYLLIWKIFSIDLFRCRVVSAYQGLTRERMVVEIRRLVHCRFSLIVWQSVGITKWHRLKTGAISIRTYKDSWLIIAHRCAACVCTKPSIEFPWFQFPEKQEEHYFPVIFSEFKQSRKTREVVIDGYT